MSTEVILEELEQDLKTFGSVVSSLLVLHGPEASIQFKITGAEIPHIAMVVISSKD